MQSTVAASIPHGHGHVPIIAKRTTSNMPQHRNASVVYPAPTTAHGTSTNSFIPRHTNASTVHPLPSVAERTCSNSSSPPPSNATVVYPAPCVPRRTYSNSPMLEHSNAPTVYHAPSVARRTYSNSPMLQPSNAPIGRMAPFVAKRTYSNTSSVTTPRMGAHSVHAQLPRYSVVSANSTRPYPNAISPEAPPSCPATPLVLSRLASNASVETYLTTAYRERTDQQSMPSYLVCAAQHPQNDNINACAVAPQYAAGMMPTPLTPSNGHLNAPSMMHASAISAQNRPRLSFTTNSSFENAHTFNHRKQQECEQSRKHELANAKELYEQEMAMCESDKQELQGLRAECRMLEEQIDLDQSLDSNIDKQFADCAALEEQLVMEVHNAERGGPVEFNELTAKLSSTKSLQEKCEDVRRETKCVAEEMAQILQQIDAKLAAREKELASMKGAIRATTENFNSMSDTLHFSIDKRRKETELKNEDIKDIVEETLPNARQEIEEFNAKIMGKNAERERLQLTESVEVTRQFKATIDRVTELTDLLTERRVGYTKLKEELAFQQEQSQTFVRAYTDLLVKEEIRGVGDRAGMMMQERAQKSRSAGDRVGMMTQGQVQKEELKNIQQQKKKCEMDLKVVEQGLKNCPSPCEDGEKRAKTRRLTKVNSKLRSQNDSLRSAIGTTK
eukprot:GEMP01011652.1.p1 GENE.GEMP01011652.1~~GEMP01011652.1.p1  ORF type:complete len:674 (+),score=128.96 GEMP01011652.1:222-2243(+)